MDLISLIDNLKIPFEIPTLLHSPVVHFAIALPVIALLLEVINLFAKKKCIGFISGLLILLAAGIYFAAFVTGKVDGKEAYALLSSEGKEELLEHKKLGIYLVYAIGALFLVKLIVIAVQNIWAKLFLILLLAGFVTASFKQGKDGGELVFEYGANVKALSHLDDKIMELEDELESLKEKCKQTTPPQTEPAAKTEAVSEPETKETETKVETTKEENSTNTIEQKAAQALETIKTAAESNITQIQNSIENNISK